MWNPGDVITWRGVYRAQIWHAMPTFVIKDTQKELVLALVPGSDCMVEENYARGKKNGKRRWHFKEENWKLADFTWHTNRLLFILEPAKYYSTILFWHHDRNEFVGYYINFQLPFTRNDSGINTLDLELDIDIEPDLSFKWKDLDDYMQGIEAGVILRDWVNEIEIAKKEILDRLGKRDYPFDGTWLDWLPDPAWSPPVLPANWDKI
jgi:protein associated with RNAse G/E